MSPLRIAALVVTLSLVAACGGNPPPVAPAATGGAGAASATPQPAVAKVIVGFSEIYEGDTPHLPRGCPAQAWSVACTLEAWWRLENARRGTRPEVVAVR